MFNNSNPQEIVAVVRKGQQEGFIVGVTLTVTTYWMYKLNKATLKDTVRKFTKEKND